MEYLDFSSVITTIRKYISDAHSMNQIDMMYQLFVSFLSSEESKDFDFDNGLVCRWFSGQAKISPRITGYYMDNHKHNQLAADMHRNVLPLMYDSAMAVQEVYNILVQDITISDKLKNRLLQNYPCETEMDEAMFLTSALCFGMERTFVKRDYLRFVEDVFPYMEKFHYVQGMEFVLKYLTELLKDDTVGSISDRALLMDYRACCEKKLDKAIKLEKDAVAMLTEITSDNAFLAANLHANLGGMYRQSGKHELAKHHMEQGIQLLEQFRLVPYHDSIPQITNYAVLLTEMGQPDIGLSALRKLSRVIREYNSDETIDFASVQEAMGNICLTIGKVQQATTHFQKAMAVYEMVFEAEPEMIEAKKQALLGTYTQTGLHIGIIQQMK